MEYVIIDANGGKPQIADDGPLRLSAWVYSDWMENDHSIELLSGPATLTNAHRSCAPAIRSVQSAFRALLLLALLARLVDAESGSKLTGRVLDPSDRAVPGAHIVVRSLATLVERTVATNGEGIYEVSALPVGTYRVQVKASGFRLYIIEPLTMEIARTVVHDVHLEVGDVSQELTVKSDATLIDAATTSVGHVINGRNVQEIPLNGRYFLDLALLVPGSVTPTSSSFSATPGRGLGALAINTAGNREETVNFMVNGITLNDLVYSSILYQPSISTVQEFKIDNSTLSAEYGQSSGAVVNVATRSGTTRFHGELFEFLRNDELDARNFFTSNSSEPPPFKRNQFGVNAGGPIVRGKTFFFTSYEGLRQAQQVNLNSVVFSEAERRSAVNANIAKLIELVPLANAVDSGGTPRYIGSAPSPIQNDQWTMNVSHNLSENDRLNGYYGFNYTETNDPNGRGNTVPGFGNFFVARRQFFSLNETHTFSRDRINEFRFGFNRLSSSNRANAELNPADYGIRNGIAEPIGLPQMSIAGGALNIGGPSTFPSGRGDTTIVVGNTLSCLCGRHSLKVGGEYRQFLNNNFRRGTGAFSFASIAAFLADTANSFSITLGNQNSSIAQGAFGFFVQDNYKLRPNLTLELGLRYDWNLTPEERFGRFIIFDPASGSLVRLPKEEDIYRQNNKNIQPRVGFAWDPFRTGKTSVRGAFGVLVDQPMTSVVIGMAANPPLASPLTVAGTIPLERAIDLAQSAGLAPATVDRGYRNAYLQSWNFNFQREVLPGFAIRAGYYGSKGTGLILRRNLNQPVSGVRPYPIVSLSSGILPGTPLGNVTQAESTGNSTYSALWLSASKTLARGLQFNVSYTWSKSLDYNSYSSQGVVVQNSYDLRADRGLSDFDARQRLVVNGTYALPFRGNRWLESWIFAVVLQAQSGNPVNIVTTNSVVNGVAGTLRPDVIGPVQIPGTVDRWFDPSAFTAVSRFGNLGRNVVIGPGFNNTDLSLVKDTAIGERSRVQFRVEFFDLLNHANFGQPGNVVGTPGFGRITSTRFQTGESGSSRQIQLGIKLIF